MLFLLIISDLFQQLNKTYAPVKHTSTYQKETAAGKCKLESCYYMEKAAGPDHLFMPFWFMHDQI